MPFISLLFPIAQQLPCKSIMWGTGFGGHFSLTKNWSFIIDKLVKLVSFKSENKLDCKLPSIEHFTVFCALFSCNAAFPPKVVGLLRFFISWHSTVKCLSDDLKYFNWHNDPLKQEKANGLMLSNDQWWPL